MAARLSSPLTRLWLWGIIVVFEGGCALPPLHVLIKPASGLCNLRCRYCFYHDVTENRAEKSRGIMSIETLEELTAKALSFAEGSCTFAFQGGEPTLAGLDFFKEAARLQQKYNVKKLPVNNAIQTNGYSLDEGWAAFFRDNHFLVGLSVDGTKDTHDANRFSPDGKGTFSQVMKAARLLERYGADFNILTVVSRATVRHARSMYAFYKKCGFTHLQFIPCLDPLGQTPGGNPYSLQPGAYGEFLMALFDLWHGDYVAGNYVSIRDFDNYIQMMAGYPPEACGMSGECGVQNVVEADGSVYPCDFYTLDEHLLGNLCRDDFADIYRQREASGFILQSKCSDESCASCEYKALCGGGCRRHKITCEDGGLGPNRFCADYKAFFSYAAPRMAAIARQLFMN